MMRVFSSRLQWDSQPNPLSTLLAEKRRGGAAILDLTESNPTRAGLAYPGSDLLAALTDLRALQYDPDPRGLLAAREAVAEYYAQRGVDVPVSRILLTASTSEAYSCLFKLLADPGDEVLVPRPSYPLFEHLTRLDGIVARSYDLEYHGRWTVDVHSLEHAMTDRTRAVLIVNPNNPTGSFVSAGELDAIADLCRDAADGRTIAIISDEVFADYALNPDAIATSAVSR